MAEHAEGSSNDQHGRCPRVISYNATIEKSLQECCQHATTGCSKVHMSGTMRMAYNTTA